MDPAFIIPRLREDAQLTVGEIKRLFDDRLEMRRLVQTDLDFYNELSIHAWHPTLGSERAARYPPAVSGRFVCPRCYIVSGLTRQLMEMTTPTTVVECAYCSYKMNADQVLEKPTQTERDTQINLEINRDK